MDITLIVEWGRVEKESHTTCDHVHQRPGVCVQEMDIMRFTEYLSLSAKMLFHSPTGDRVSELQSVVSDVLPITAFTWVSILAPVSANA